MQKLVVERRTEFRLLTADEMTETRGGSVVDYLMKFASWGASYFFHMGVQEGRRMRALL